MIVSLLLDLASAAGPPRPSVLRDAWSDYKRHYVQADGRVIDPRGSVTTSEGQAYGMTRAAFAGDRAGFALIHQWTVANLQFGDPTVLPAWRWGPRPDGSWGILDPSPASDADMWMAWALLHAERTFGVPGYATAADGLIDAIAREEVITLGDRTLVLPGPWARDGDPVEINPSYFLPFAAREFAKRRPSPWQDVLDDGYALLSEWMADHRLPPDWAYVDREGKLVGAPPGRRPDPQRFGFEAMRIPWALAADALWHNDPRADQLLQPIGHLASRWRAEGRLAARMELNGLPVVDYASAALYGSLLPAWGRVAPDDAEALYRLEVAPGRTPPGWGPADDYFAQNWAWLGVALWSGLAQSVPN